MAKNYKIQFVSLRAGTTYVLNIGGGSGTAVQLSGAMEPFVTNEDTNDDMFQPIRTQSGSIRILDNQRDYGGTLIDATNPDDWWKDLLPSTDSSRPVTLKSGNTTVWMGFMQSQTFSGELYGGTQERDFPVLCPLGVLAGEDVDYNAGLQNFAYILKSVCDTIDVKSGGTLSGGVITVNGAVHITDVYVQGGSDARNWLMTKIDFQNFAQENGNGVVSAKYSLYSVLEDMCRFWGWTARICGTVLYLTAADDSAEQVYLSLTRAQLNTLAGGTSAGNASVTIPTMTISDTSALPIFSDTDQTDYKVQGPHKAVVKADCNEHDTIVKFAPKDIEEWMGNSYSWVQGGDDLVGYFTTPTKQGTNIGTSTLKVSTGSYGGMSRRQIYQSTDTESPMVGDMLMSLANRPNYNSPIIQLQTLRPMSFGGGSISLGGTLWRGAEPIQHDRNLYVIRMRLGIGMTRETAKWWYMTKEISSQSAAITCGWSTTVNDFNVPMQGNTLKGTGLLLNVAAVIDVHFVYSYPAIPVPANQNLYGYVFIDIIGGHDYSNGNDFDNFEIANFSIDYSRDSYDIPSSLNVVRPRELKTERVTSQEYSSTNSNDSKDEWNANCIFASDNNMEYGYGLLLDANGNIISTVNYGGTPQHPEQHLANRVATYWNTAKRMLDLNVMANHIGAVTPHTKVTLSTESGQTFIPLAISHNWHDDVVKLTLIQL